MTKRPRKKPDEPAWFAVRCATRQEIRAAGSLRELGIEVFLPVETRWCRHARTQTRKDRPLFVGYVFARLRDEDIYFAEQADGVHTIVGVDRQYVTIDEADLAQLAFAQWLGVFDQTWTPDMRRKVKAGAKVKVSAGKLAGAWGEVLEARGDRKVTVLLQLFGRARKATLPVAEIEELDDAA